MSPPERDGDRVKKNPVAAQHAAISLSSVQHTTRSTRRVEDLVEEAIDVLTSEQLFAVAARKAARELRRQEEAARPKPTWVECMRAADIEDVYIAAAIGGTHLLHGDGHDEARAAVEAAGLTWIQRTAEEKERAVAKGMLQDGFTPAMIADALKKTEAIAC